VSVKLDTWHITLNKDDWQQSSYLALCGVTDIPLLHFLSQKKDTNMVILCLDNDRAGLEASKRIAEKLDQQGYIVTFNISQEKDWNEQLCINAQEQSMKIC
jgi:DNA primase